LLWNLIAFLAKPAAQSQTRALHPVIDIMEVDKSGINDEFITSSESDNAIPLPRLNIRLFQTKEETDETLLYPYGAVHDLANFR